MTLRTIDDLLAELEARKWSYILVWPGYVSEDDRFLESLAWYTTNVDPHWVRPIFSIRRLSDITLLQPVHGPLIRWTSESSSHTADLIQLPADRLVAVLDQGQSDRAIALMIELWQTLNLVRGAAVFLSVRSEEHEELWNTIIDKDLFQEYERELNPGLPAPASDVMRKKRKRKKP